MTAAVWGPPDNLRLVVLDLETCVAPDKKHRIVSLGVVVCRGGAIKQRFEWLINPEVPVDARTGEIHGLADWQLADEPTFDEVLPDFMRRLVGEQNETVVLAAHNAGFDLGWLRSEAKRVKAPPLPDLPVLDTQGALLGLAGLSLRRPRLRVLLEALSLTNAAEHHALADASATALAAIELLERADARGHGKLPALLAAAGATTSNRIRRRRATIADRPSVQVAAPPIPLPHIGTHAHELPAKPRPGQLASWRGWIAECAQLRCDSLGSRVGPEPLLRGLLLTALDRSASAGDVAGTATILGALLPSLGRLPGSIAEMRRHGPPLVRVPGAGNQRGVALALHGWLEPRLAPLGRCRHDDPCPTCREGLPCPLDTWRTALVPSVIGDKESQVVAFWNTKTQTTGMVSKGSGRGYLAMRRTAPALADASLRACLAFHRGSGDRATAALVGEQVWQQARCEDPAITEMRATTIAAGGRPADLRAAIRACQAVLPGRRGSTDPAWVSLEARTSQLIGRERRLRHSAKERHHPETPVRAPRSPRFLRAS